tara:strand:+ start:228 stop:485 length:258 start_codon:yes stop_codon:yes gene_type:complete
MMSKDVAEWCGYSSMSAMILDHLDNQECMDLLSEFLEANFEGWASEMVQDLAKEHHEWVDHDAIRADYEDMKYQEYKDRGIDDDV